MENKLKRFWVSWWSGYFERDGCTIPPFQVWISGSRDNDIREIDELSICAVIDAEDEPQIWKAVQKHFPDMQPRFIKEEPADFAPGDRFPDFKNQTSLT